MLRSSFWRASSCSTCRSSRRAFASSVFPRTTERARAAMLVDPQELAVAGLGAGQVVVPARRGDAPVLEQERPLGEQHRRELARHDQHRDGRAPGAHRRAQAVQDLSARSPRRGRSSRRRGSARTGGPRARAPARAAGAGPPRGSRRDRRSRYRARRAAPPRSRRRPPAAAPATAPPPSPRAPPAGCWRRRCRRKESSPGGRPGPAGAAARARASRTARQPAGVRAEPHLARVGVDEPRDERGQGGLARAGRADQGDDLARRDRQRAVGEHVGLPARRPDPDPAQRDPERSRRERRPRRSRSAARRPGAP